MTNGIMPEAVASPPRRAMLAACTAHWLHDGYLDLTYVLLPIWQAQFGLDYAALALIRGTYAGTMAAAQVPVDRKMATLGSWRSLALGTVVAAAGFVLVGVSSGAVLLCAALVVAGLGSSTQHPRGSVIVTQTYGDAAKGPLGIYNFAGDLGKATFPALTSALLLALSWRHTIFVLAAIGVLVAGALALAHADTAQDDLPASQANATTGIKLGASFAVLFAIGMLDTAPRMGFLLLLPFVLGGLHASPSTIGIGLALVFAGGAFGKFACGWIGTRLGFVGTVATTEGATALMILAVPVLPLPALLALLPLLGVALNGTSTVLYGTVPEAARGSDIGRAFALFYTGVIGAGAVAPIGYGLIADVTGRATALVVIALTALATIPLGRVLHRMLAEPAEDKRPRLPSSPCLSRKKPR